MNLVVVERTSDRTGNVVPKVSVSPKGTFYVNTKAMERMGVDDNTRVKFLQDKDDKSSWYIHICKDGYIKLKKKDEKKDGSGQIFIKDIALKLIDSFHHTGTKSLKFKLKEAVEWQGKKYYPLEVIKESIQMEIPDPNGRI